MWINRYQKKQYFIKIINNINNQSLIVRGARQVGKTSFVLNILEDIKAPQIYIDCLRPGGFILGSSKLGSNFIVLGKKNRLGRDFLGRSPTAFINNIHLYFKSHGPIDTDTSPIIFIDEADQAPYVLEWIQTLAEYSAFKFIITGSNLENVSVKNAATGRKCFFDLYPITFYDYLHAANREDLVNYCNEQSLKKFDHSDYFHHQLTEVFQIYMRLGGMPRLIDCYLDPKKNSLPLPHIASDLVTTIEENVKAVLGEKAKLYEYHDVLRTLARLSLNTLKYKHLQVSHAGRLEAKRLVIKTIGARVAHKIRLMNAKSDLSKYILFDSGIANFLLAGSNLLMNVLSSEHMGILSETVIANEIIAQLTTRDDLFYWKSENMAEVEFLIRSPVLAGIDVKTKDGTNKSLASFALREKKATILVKIADKPPHFDKNYIAQLSTGTEQRQIPLLKVPHYLVPRLFEYLKEFKDIL